jgi:hypothetical protein
MTKFTYATKFDQVTSVTSLDTVGGSEREKLQAQPSVRHLLPHRFAVHF